MHTSLTALNWTRADRSCSTKAVGPVRRCPRRFAALLLDMPARLRLAGRAWLARHTAAVREVLAAVGCGEDILEAGQSRPMHASAAQGASGRRAQELDSPLQDRQLPVPGSRAGQPVVY